MKIVLARPDVSIPLHVAVILVMSVLGNLLGAIWYVTGRASSCEVSPLLSVSCALFSIFPWNLRHTRFFVRGRLTAGLTIGLAAILALVGTACRL
jgi:hypothetical protein